MTFLSATDLAIALAHKNGHLRVTERPSRLGGTYLAIEDRHGLIEVHNTQAEWDARLGSIIAGEQDARERSSQRREIQQMRRQH